MQLLSGGNHDIDITDLRNHTRYTGGYTEGSRTVKLFWEVLIPQEQKIDLFILLFGFLSSSFIVGGSCYLPLITLTSQ